MERALSGDVAVRYTQPFWWVIPMVPGQSLMRLANKPERAHSGSANPDGLNSAVVESVQTLGRSLEPLLGKRIAFRVGERESE
jgi:hypothetical protein